MISSVRKYFILYYTKHWFWHILWCSLSYVKRRRTPYSCVWMECKKFPGDKGNRSTIFSWEPLLIDTEYQKMLLCFPSTIATPATRMCPSVKWLRLLKHLLKSTRTGEGGRSNEWLRKRVHKDSPHKNVEARSEISSLFWNENRSDT